MLDVIPRGAMTAIVTPFNQASGIDWQGLEKNVNFQIEQGISGLVPVGTTGESPTLSVEEHIEVINQVTQTTDLFTLAGVGSNSTEEMLMYAGRVNPSGFLLVDCYYNKPASAQLMENYYRRAAEEFPDKIICPYVIPGRTCCQLLPEHLALLAQDYPNICLVKEATGDIDRMARTRELLPPPGFFIFSGDDNITLSIMRDPAIRANGVVSVMSNIAPAAVQAMCQSAICGEAEKAKEIESALWPLFSLVTVKANSTVFLHGKPIIIQNKFPNPCAIKTMMQGLGMPAGIPRNPLGKMDAGAVNKVRKALETVWKENPWVLGPIEDFYNVNISKRLKNDDVWEDLMT